MKGGGGAVLHTVNSNLIVNCRVDMAHNYRESMWLAKGREHLALDTLGDQPWIA